MTDHLRRLFAHLAWADARALESLRRAPGQAQARELLAHVLAAEHVWLIRLTGSPQRIHVWPDLSLEECAKLAEETRAAFTAFVAGLTAGDVGRRIAYVNSAGHAFEDTVEDILLHVALHGCYHRGQIAAEVRASGAAPSPTDYIAFIRGAPAATRADAAHSGV